MADVEEYQDYQVYLFLGLPIMSCPHAETLLSLDCEKFQDYVHVLCDLIVYWNNLNIRRTNIHRDHWMAYVIITSWYNYTTY